MIVDKVDIHLERRSLHLVKRDTHLPAEFIENRIIVQPKTLLGTTIRFLTDTGGGYFIKPEAATKANLCISEGVVDGSRRDLAEPPTFQASDWIPPLIIKGENAKYPVIDQDLFYLGEDIDGLIGQAWFANRVWTFDYLADEMVFHEVRVSETPKVRNRETAD